MMGSQAWFALANLLASALLGGRGRATYYLQRRGELKHLLTRYEVTEVSPATREVQFYFHAFFFNEATTPTGLWEPHVVFECEGHEVFSSSLQEVVLPSTLEELNNIDIIPLGQTVEVLEFPRERRYTYTSSGRPWVRTPRRCWEATG